MTLSPCASQSLLRPAPLRVSAKHCANNGAKSRCTRRHLRTSRRGVHVHNHFCTTSVRSQIQPLSSLPPPSVRQPSPVDDSLLVRRLVCLVRPRRPDGMPVVLCPWCALVDSRMVVARPSHASPPTRTIACLPLNSNLCPRVFAMCASELQTLRSRCLPLDRLRHLSRASSAGCRSAPRQGAFGYHLQLCAPHYPPAKPALRSHPPRLPFCRARRRFCHHRRLVRRSRPDRCHRCRRHRHCRLLFRNRPRPLVPRR